MDVTERVSTALACFALDPNLAGLLFLDLDPALIYPLADWLADLLGDEPPVISLGPKLTEEALWERTVADREREGIGFRWTPGPLAGYSRRPGIVVVPDLAPLSLPAARAAATLVGADVAHLERSGVSLSWRPRDWWLATLRRQDAGLIAPHLLDRFTLRVDAGDLSLPRDRGPVLPMPDPTWVQAVRAAHNEARLPLFPAGAADRVVTLILPGAPGARRDIALGRLARALAGLAGEPEVRPSYVDDAAELIGLGTGAGQPMAANAGTRVVAEAAWPENDLHDGVTAGDDVAGPTQPDGVSGRPPAIAPGEPELLPPELVGSGAALAESDRSALSKGLYPEDDAVPQRDADPLRVGRRPARAGPQHGHPIGTRRALEATDIAVTATLLEAARYQETRSPGHRQERPPLRVLARDLRSYRRAPRAASLLVLVLDHTCRAQVGCRVEDWDWFEEFAPYLRWAYVTRAQVGVVEVGALDPGDGELRATQFRCRNLLDPRVPAALERLPGRATPLAHGLILAAAMLRHDTQQGGAPVGEAILVVVTDGRGNVPLTASQLDTPPEFVGRSGVRDALDAARAIRAMHRVRSVVINPGLELQSHLSVTLAEALGAPLVSGTAADTISIPFASTRASGAA